MINLGEALKEARAAKDILTARIAILEAEITEILEKGGVINGYVLRNSVGRTDWNLPAEEIAKMVDREGFDIRKDLELITPTQAKKLGVSAELVDSCSSKTKGEMKLYEVNN